MKAWIKAAVIRAIKTFAQVFVGGIAVGAAISEVDWKYIASVAAVSAIASIATSVAGLPEAGKPFDSLRNVESEGDENDD